MTHRRPAAAMAYHGAPRQPRVRNITQTDTHRAWRAARRKAALPRVWLARATARAALPRQASRRSLRKRARGRVHCPAWLGDGGGDARRCLRAHVPASCCAVDSLGVRRQPRPREGGHGRRPGKRSRGFDGGCVWRATRDATARGLPATFCLHNCIFGIGEMITHAGGQATMRAAPQPLRSRS